MVNDSCDTATSVTVGSTSYAMVGSIDFASSIDSTNSSALSCSTVMPESITMWFEIEGEGNCIKSSLVSDFESSMGLYTGDCGALSCLSETGPYDAVMSWRATNGTIYKIVVASAAEAATGDFVLSFVISDDCEEDGGNDKCTRATEVTTLPFQDQISDPGASYFDDSGLPCSLVNSFNATSGRWYSVEGTGKCFSASSLGDHSVVLAVLQGNSCDNLACVEQKSNAGGDSRTLVVWETEIRMSYQVFAGHQVSGGATFALAVRV